MVVLGLDISKRSLGAAVGDASGSPRTLRASFAVKDRAASWVAYTEWLRGIIRFEKPAFIAFEAALPKVDRFHSQEVARLLNGYAVATEILCHSRGIACSGVAANTWRAAFYGSGNLRRDDAKKAAIRLCQQLGWPVDAPGADDKADACGVWAWGHLFHGQQHQMRDMLSRGAVRRMAVELDDG